MKAVFAGKAQPGAVGAARRLLASGLAIVTVNSPATHHALKEAGIAHQDVRGNPTPALSPPPHRRRNEGTSVIDELRPRA